MNSNSIKSKNSTFNNVPCSSNYSIETSNSYNPSSTIFSVSIVKIALSDGKAGFELKIGLAPFGKEFRGLMTIGKLGVEADEFFEVCDCHCYCHCP